MADNVSQSETSATKGRVSRAKSAIAEQSHDARETLEKGYRKARQTATSAYSDAHDVAEHAIDSARNAAKRVTRRGHDALDTTPLAVLLGGLAVGAVAGSLLPATRRERDAMRPVGRQVRSTAYAAADAAKAAGRDRLDDLGLTPDNARVQLGDLLTGLLKVLGDAGKAAGNEVRQSSKR